MAERARENAAGFGAAGGDGSTEDGLARDWRRLKSGLERIWERRDGLIRIREDISNRVLPFYIQYWDGEAYRDFRRKRDGILDDRENSLRARYFATPQKAMREAQKLSPIGLTGRGRGLGPDLQPRRRPTREQSGGIFDENA